MMDKYITVCGNTRSCHFNKKMEDIMRDMIKHKSLVEWNEWSSSNGMWRTIVDDKPDFKSLVSNIEDNVKQIESRMNMLISGLSKLLTLTMFWCIINTFLICSNL